MQETRTQAQTSKLPRVSASKLKLYERCPTQYQYQYLRGEKQKPNIWGIIGSAAHKSIELFYREKIPIMATFAERASDLPPDTENLEQYATTFASIRLGLMAFNPDTYAPMYVDEKPQLEKYFRLKYPNDEEPICTIEGYIDMITHNDCIVDFKTGSDIPTKKGMKRDLQFIIYAWAFKRIYGREPGLVIYHRIRNNKQIFQSEFAYEYLDEMVKRFLADPMTYEPIPCEDCAWYCGVRKYATH